MRVVALLWILAGCLVGQSQWPIASLTVEGATHYPAAKILAVSGLRVGQLADKAAFDTAREKLLATGYFETVGYSYEPGPGKSGYAAKFQVQEVQPLYPVQIVGIAGDAQAMQDSLGEGDPLYRGVVPGTKETLDRLSHKLAEYLARISKPDAIVAKLVPVSGGFAVQLRPRAVPNVAGGKFTGNKVLTDTALQNAINNVAVGTAFTDYDFRTLLDAQIRPLYEREGYLRVKFGKITTEDAPLVTGVNVTIEIDEGPQYKLGKVTLLGQLGDMGPELQTALDIKNGAFANYDELDAGLKRLLAFLRRKGYVKASGEVRKTVHDASKTVDAQFVFNKGAQYRFESLEISGLDLDGEAAVRKLWAENRGDPFNPDYPEFFAKQVKESGMFENMGTAKVRAQLDAVALTAVVTLDFQGNGEKRKRLGEPPPTQPL